MLINLSNHHPYAEKWEEKQIQAALSEFGEIKDLPFPAIEPELNEDELEEKAREYVEKCKQILSNPSDGAIFVTGELNFCFLIIQLLLNEGYRCVTTTSIRNVTEKKGKKIVHYEFRQFRDYKLIKR